MLLMVNQIIGVNQDVVQVDDYRDVQEIGEDFIHEMLEGQWSIWQAKWYYELFEQAVMSVEGCLPLIPLGNAYHMISTLQVYFWVYLHLSRSIQEII